MNRIHAVGIIVDALPFRDYDCILTLFCPNEGLIKTVIRAAYSSKNGKGAGITAPLSGVSLVYSKGKGDLYSCHEISVVSHRLELRRDLPTLQAACDMLQAIATTQQPAKPAPELYSLLEAYLRKLSDAANPAAIAASFRLKMLRYEGLLGFLSHCCSCAAPLKECYVVEGEALCPEHSPTPEGLFLSQDDRATIELLAFSRNISEVASQEIPPSFAAVVSRLYREMLGN